ncbi:TPA: MFS transporter, partial [Yersinia enterocolitica]|nr:MFS transporter [Yersinia enterocolitica]
MSGIFAFFKAAPAIAPQGVFNEKKFITLRWGTFLSMTVAYVMFYVCRLSFTVAKSALVEIGITPTELGMIGSALFFCYAIGKLVNGFIADHANVVRFMSLGLLLSAGMNFMMGTTTNALLLTLFWGINGWAQSMGVGPCVVSLARWYGDKERGTFYSIWSTAHKIGLLNTFGFALMIFMPRNHYTDILAMIIFGATIGALTCFLGGLIAVDISSKKAAGAALGTIGIASYAGAGLGEFITGVIIDKTSVIEAGKTLYNFHTLSIFWIVTGLLSALLTFITAGIVARRQT